MDTAKIITLQAIENTLSEIKFKPNSFEDLIKLRILILDQNEEVSKLANKIYNE